MVNRRGGAVEVSTEAGQAWEAFGKVVRPAVAAVPANPVVSIAPAGSVAGVSPEQVLVRLPTTSGSPRVLRVTAAGEPEAASAIGTDVPAGGPLFRGLAPPVGSPALLERAGHTAPLPPDYSPKPDDALVFVVRATPQGDPPVVTIENKVGGEVVFSTTGGVPRVLARVKQPLKGIGRYSHTERTGAGAVLAWSPTTVLVSTSGRSRVAPGGEGSEMRGGFVIQPSEPSLQGATNPASQLLLEGVPEGSVHPPVSRFFGLEAPVSDSDPLDLQPTQVEVKIDGGDWEPCPDLRGAVGAENFNRALERARGGKAVKEGITAIRITFGTLRQAGLRRRILLAVTPAAKTPQHGTVTITANVMGQGVFIVQFFLDGRQTKFTNIQPYTWSWDTTTALDGEHLVEIRGVDDNGAVVSSVVTKVIVDN